MSPLEMVAANKLASLCWLAFLMRKASSALLIQVIGGNELNQL